jgi:hypothetical protein
MSVIEAASIGVRTMADGTLRLTVDVEPRHAQAAFALFGAPGVPMALAALKVGAAADAKSDEVAPAEEAKRDKPIAKWLALRCKEPEFQAWLTERGDFAKPLDEQRCAEVVRAWCNVESRGDIDGDPSAEARFHAMIRGPYSKHHVARTA